VPRSTPVTRANFYAKQHRSMLDDRESSHAKNHTIKRHCACALQPSTLLRTCHVTPADIHHGMRWWQVMPVSLLLWLHSGDKHKLNQAHPEALGHQRHHKSTCKHKKHTCQACTSCTQNAAGNAVGGCPTGTITPAKISSSWHMSSKAGVCPLSFHSFRHHSSPQKLSLHQLPPGLQQA
jgi:hypothetical protein